MSKPRPGRKMAVEPGQTLSLPAVYLWMRPPRRGLTVRGLAKATTPITVKGMSPSEAPIECFLAAPTGEWMPVRRSGDKWFRPIVAPGEWRAATVAEFAEAAEAGWPWVDNPAIGRPVNQRWMVAFPTALGADEVAVEVDPQTDEEALAKDAAAAAALQRCAGLCAIGGEIWTEIPEPVLIVTSGEFLRHHPKGRLAMDCQPRKKSVTWRAGSLRGEEPQATFTIGSAGPLMDCTMRQVPLKLPLCAADAAEAWVAEWNNRTPEAPKVRWSEGRSPDSPALALVTLLRRIAAAAVEPGHIDCLSRTPSASCADAYTRAERAILAGDRDAIAGSMPKITGPGAEGIAPWDMDQHVGFEALLAHACAAIDAAQEDGDGLDGDAITAAFG